MIPTARWDDGRPIPGPHQLLGLRSSLGFRRDALGFLERAFATWGDAVQFKLGGQQTVAVFDPEGVAALLALPDDALEKSAGIVAERGRRLGGTGIVTTAGDEHRLHRAVAQRVLAPAPLRRYREQIAALTDTELGGWGDGSAVDLGPALQRLARNAAIRLLFGHDPADPACAGMLEALEVLVRDLDVLWPGWTRRAEVDAARRAFAALEAWSADLADRAPCVARDLLDEGRRASSDWALPEVLGNLVQLYMTSYDTTLNSLFWTLWLLAHHPAAADRARAEVDAGPDAEGEWTDACIKESLRLYPTGPYAFRRPVRDVRIGRIAVPVGVTVLYSPWVTHRHPSAWDTPERFRPERFLGSPAPRKGAYVPFGLGSRSCVGAALGTLQVRTVLTRILARFSVAPIPGIDVRPRSMDAVHPVPGVSVRLGPRADGPR